MFNTTTACSLANDNFGFLCKGPTIGERRAEHGKHRTKSILYPLMIESPNPEDR